MRTRSKSKYTVKNHCFESMQFLIFYLTSFDSKKFTNKVPSLSFIEGKFVTNVPENTVPSNFDTKVLIFFRLTEKLKSLYD